MGTLQNGQLVGFYLPHILLLGNPIGIDFFFWCLDLKYSQAFQADDRKSDLSGFLSLFTDAVGAEQVL